MQPKGYLFKLKKRPITVEDALRYRYYLKVCTQAIILQALDDMQMSYDKVLLNCEPLHHPLALDVEQPTVYRELQEFQALLNETVRGVVTAGCSVLAPSYVLNIAVSLYDHDQLLVSHEVYYR